MNRLTRTQLRAYKKLVRLSPEDEEWLEYVPEDRSYIAETIKKFKAMCDEAGIEMPEYRG